MDDFRGDLKWIHQWEGHNGKPYWPKGRSGLTLDPGVDLGYAEWALVVKAYGALLTPAQLEDLKRASGLKGEAAQVLLAEAQRDKTPLTTIRISRDQADQLFGFVAEPYWKMITGRFGALKRNTTPGPVHTVFLSLAYNRGANNKDLDRLREHLDKGNWQALGQTVAAMQQDHALAGIRRRRQEEGRLIMEHV